jgi:hypothetical protein
LPIDGLAALELVARERLRHPRLELLATDRAGTVARVSRSVTVRVVARPLRAFELAPDDDFASSATPATAPWRNS